MDPFTTFGEQRELQSLLARVVSLLCAIAGLSLATTSIDAEETFWLVAGVVLGVAGPVLIELVLRRSA